MHGQWSENKLNKNQQRLEISYSILCYNIAVLTFSPPWAWLVIFSLLLFIGGHNTKSITPHTDPKI